MYIEEIRYIFDKVVPVVSHLEVLLPDKPFTPKKIGESIKGPQINYVEKLYFCNMTRTKMSALFSLPY